MILSSSKTIKRSRCSIVGRNVLRTRLAPFSWVQAVSRTRRALSSAMCLATLLVVSFQICWMCGSSFFQSDIQILRYLKLQACPNHPWPNMTKRILCGFFCSFVACAFMISLKAAKIPKTTGAESRKHRTSAPFFAVIPYSWPRVLSSSDIFRLSHA